MATQWEIIEYLEQNKNKKVNVHDLSKHFKCGNHTMSTTLRKLRWWGMVYSENKSIPSQPHTRNVIRYYWYRPESEWKK